MSFSFIACEQRGERIAECHEWTKELYGLWKEVNDQGGKPAFWEFKQTRVNWDGFGHTFECLGETIIISGISYKIRFVGNKDTIEIKKVGTNDRFLCERVH